MGAHRSSGYYLISDGLLTLFVGLVLLFLTGLSQFWVVYLFSAYAVVYGIAQLIAARGEREPDQNPAAFWAIGIFSIAAGLGLLFYRGTGLSTVITLMAGYAIVVGLAEAVTAFAYSDIHGYGWLATMGTFKALFGLLLLAATSMTLSSLVLAVSVYAILEGSATTAFGYQLSQSVHEGTKIPEMR